MITSLLQTDLKSGYVLMGATQDTLQIVSSQVLSSRDAWVQRLLNLGFQLNSFGTFLPVDVHDNALYRDYNWLTIGHLSDVLGYNQLVELAHVLRTPYYVGYGSYSMSVEDDDVHFDTVSIDKRHALDLLYEQYQQFLMATENDFKPVKKLVPVHNDEIQYGLDVLQIV